MSDWVATRGRKAGHLRIALEDGGRIDRGAAASGFDQLRFIPNALPEIDLWEIDTSSTLFGRRLGAPLLISSMTGGTDEAGRLNRILAQSAQKYRVGMGLGSARVLLENPRLLPTFDVRAQAPDVLLFANLGAVQLNQGVTVADCERLVRDLQADGLILHLNPIQEGLQPRGDTVFRGLLAKIGALTRDLHLPVVVKEVGFGLAPDVVIRLLDAGVAAVDVAGAGGTSWPWIEGRLIHDQWRSELCDDLTEWGLPTATAIRQAREAAPQGLIIGSGGVRSGVDVAKAIGLGANVVGVGRPLLKAASQDLEATDSYLRRLVDGLRLAMFGIGAPDLHSLRGTDRLTSTS